MPVRVVATARAERTRAAAPASSGRDGVTLPGGQRFTALQLRGAAVAAPR